MTNAILNNGWEIIQGQSIENENLIKIAKTYGVPFPDSNQQLIQKLNSKNKKTGIKNSFSYNYGLSAFPYHTDTAFDNTPANYFLLTSLYNSKTTTNIIDSHSIINNLNNEEIKILKKSIFLLSTPQEKKFTNLIFVKNKKTGIRFDPNIMTPYNSYSKDALAILNEQITKTKTIEIKWNKEQILIVDNWRCIHSRSNVIDEKRTLKRIYIK
ncbi:TauD/TfdA family dioxygenase [Nonlabens ulvanivorans]|uniref:TauD/TfdA family dioxygenase n=1 Tax=Nonlabens ulvanivorans TaxID=906888 RepID=UPI0037C74A0A